MSVATERKAPWYTRDYLRMVSVAHDSGVLRVAFADGARVEVKVEDLLGDHPVAAAWDRLVFDEHEIVVPTADGDIEIPWDVIRVQTDPAFEQHLATKHAEQAKLVGSHLTELRRAGRLSGRELADAAGITPERLARIEAGDDGVSLPTLERLVAALGHEMRVFIVHDEEEPRS